MDDKELKFYRSCHVLYSKACKKQIQEKIEKHYPSEQREEIWTSIQLKYIENYIGKQWKTMDFTQNL